MKFDIIDLQEKTKYFCMDNDFALSFSAFVEKTSTFYIQAMEDCELLCINANILHNLIDHNIYWQSIYSKLLEKTYLLKEKREAEFLFNNAKTRYIKFLEEYPSLVRRVKMQYIAQYLGINPVSLSRIRAKLKLTNVNEK